MPGFALERHVDAPPATTFAVASDLAHAADHVAAIESLEILTEGPVGAGTRFRETRRILGKEATEEMEITAFDPPSSYTVECHSHGTHYVSVFTFAPERDGTRLVLDFRANPQTLLAKLLSPLGLLMQGSMRKLMRQDLDGIAREAETRAAA